MEPDIIGRTLLDYLARLQPFSLKRPRRRHKVSKGPYHIRCVPMLGGRASSLRGMQRKLKVVSGLLVLSGSAATSSSTGLSIKICEASFVPQAPLRLPLHRTVKRSPRTARKTALSCCPDPSFFPTASMPTTIMAGASSIITVGSTNVLSGGNLASTSTSGADSDSAAVIATALGYLIGTGSLLLYTPIAVRVWRNRNADGLALSTWWLKLASYASSDVYYISRALPLSTYVETLTITVESAAVLLLVSYFQGRLFAADFAAKAALLGLACLYGLTAAPENVTAGLQVATIALNSGALIPQFKLNAASMSKGDYSPLTAGLATVGCTARLFTTAALAGNDPVLLLSFGVALVLNGALLAQILYYGSVVEGLSVRAIFAADLGKDECPQGNIVELETFFAERKERRPK